jgi:hypothetical protein
LNLNLNFLFKIQWTMACCWLSFLSREVAVHEQLLEVDNLLSCPGYMLLSQRLEPPITRLGRRYNTNPYIYILFLYYLLWMFNLAKWHKILFRPFSIKTYKRKLHKMKKIKPNKSLRVWAK